MIKCSASHRHNIMSMVITDIYKLYTSVMVIEWCRPTDIYLYLLYISVCRPRLPIGVITVPFFLLRLLSILRRLVGQQQLCSNARARTRATDLDKRSRLLYRLRRARVIAVRSFVVLGIKFFFFKVDGKDGGPRLAPCRTSRHRPPPTAVRARIVQSQYGRRPIGFRCRAYDVEFATFVHSLFRRVQNFPVLRAVSVADQRSPALQCVSVDSSLSFCQCIPCRGRID